jgi:hypothetical protein
MRQLVFVSLARSRRRGSASVGAGFACLSIALLAFGCASRSLIPEAQVVAIKQRERALASHAAAIQGAIRQSGQAGVLAFLDADDGHLVVLPGDSPADAWARYTTAPESANGRVSVPAVVTFVHRADIPKAPEIVTRSALEQEQATRASAAALEEELRDAYRRIDERLASVQRELGESIAAAMKDTDASLGAARADMQKALSSVADDLESVRKFMLQTAQLGWLNHELNVENAGAIRKLATASQELPATSARLQESMRQLSETIGGQLRELGNRLDALQGQVTSLK